MLIFGGLISFSAWMLCALFCFVTVIGIPIGIQCMKLAVFSLNPFHKTVIFTGSFASLIANYIWLSIRIPVIFLNLILGIVLMITIIGISFAKQHFKIAQMAFMPFGTHAV